MPIPLTSEFPSLPPPVIHRTSEPHSDLRTETRTSIPCPSIPDEVLYAMSTPDDNIIRRRTSRVDDSSADSVVDGHSRHLMSAIREEIHFQPTSQTTTLSHPPEVSNASHHGLQPIFIDGKLSESPLESPADADSSPSITMPLPIQKTSSSFLHDQSDYFDARSGTSSHTIRLFPPPQSSTPTDSETSATPPAGMSSWSLPGPSTGTMRWNGGRGRFFTDAEKKRE